MNVENEDANTEPLSIVILAEDAMKPNYFLYGKFTSRFGFIAILKVGATIWSLLLITREL